MAPFLYTYGGNNMSRKSIWKKLLKAESRQNKDKAQEYWWRLLRCELKKKQELQKRPKKDD